MYDGESAASAIRKHMNPSCQSDLWILTRPALETFSQKFHVNKFRLLIMVDLTDQALLSGILVVDSYTIYYSEWQFQKPLNTKFA